MKGKAAALVEANNYFHSDGNLSHKASLVEKALTKHYRESSLQSPIRSSDTKKNNMSINTKIIDMKDEIYRPLSHNKMNGFHVDGLRNRFWNLSPQIFQRENDIYKQKYKNLRSKQQLGSINYNNNTYYDYIQNRQNNNQLNDSIMSSSNQLLSKNFFMSIIPKDVIEMSPVTNKKIILDSKTLTLNSLKEKEKELLCQYPNKLIKYNFSDGNYFAHETMQSNNANECL